MRLLVLGQDANGRSCVAENSDVAPAAIDGIPGASIAQLFATNQSPPPPCPPGLGKRLEDRLAPGLVRWYVIDHEPHAVTDEPSAAVELHHRNAIDLVVILSGDAQLILGDGPHPVGTGDCIVMAGTDHGMLPGPNGCRLLSFAVGTPPPAQRTAPQAGPPAEGAASSHQPQRGTG
jgi:mannose-6-phosphate isomerase-like protein (cupin superfamily)